MSTFENYLSDNEDFDNENEILENILDDFIPSSSNINNFLENKIDFDLSDEEKKLSIELELLNQQIQQLEEYPTYAQIYDEDLETCSYGLINKDEEIENMDWVSLFNQFDKDIEVDKNIEVDKDIEVDQTKNEEISENKEMIEKEEKDKKKKKKKEKDEDLLANETSEKNLEVFVPILKKKSKNDKLIKEIKDVSLYPYQEEHKDLLISILKDFPFVLDFSMLGTGKTFTSSWIFQNNPEQFKHIIVIVPVSVKSKWNIMVKEYSLKMDYCISFSELRSSKFKQPKHPLLYRKDYMAKVEYKDTTEFREIEKCDFQCTKKYLDWVKEGTLLIIDEIQNIKNSSEQSNACQELIRPIVEEFEKTKKQSNSRIILLSGSPVDKKEQVLHFMKVLGIMKSDRLAYFNIQLYQTVWKGMQEIEDFAISLGGIEKVDEVKEKYFNNYIGEKAMTEYTYQLFQNIIKQYLSSTMLPFNISSKIYKYNGYYKLQDGKDKKPLELLKKGIKLLSKATRYNSYTNSVNFTTSGIQSLRSVQSSLMMIETAKIPLFTRIVRKRLETHKSMKIVICVNYTKTIDDLKICLSEYNPLVLNGKLSSKKRIETIDLFQQPNNNHRLLIGNVSVCSSGIDLDDQYGKFPRMCLVSPNYSTITLYQLCHRFQRANTKSNSIVHFVFCEEATELSILNALAIKSSIMKEITEKQVEYGIQFPVDFESWYETVGVKKRMEEKKLLQEKKKNKYSTSYSTSYST